MQFSADQVATAAGITIDQAVRAIIEVERQREAYLRAGNASIDENDEVDLPGQTFTSSP